ncbi:LysR family transcriptional regulator [Novacetimonas pomaceti]|uniref:LysR family transcriptional regulator n=1 Tax=Novacetimonas pomaceti TaxID=2021998 RepID=UPI001C2D89A1|nr:LysR family transcriptional regulator [Novacetimonas pomaceti]
MALARRFLPSISLLCSFEAAARHQNFTTAATELHLTQSAISRHIRALEAQLGAELFIRERQTVRLTIAGEVYAREIREALKHISTATLGFRASPSGGTFNLAVLPTFGARWLAPRVPAFQRLHPDITINLFTRPVPFEFAAEMLDAAIHYGLADWPGAEMEFLMHEQVVPVCSPDMAGRFDFRAPADLLRAPLLHLVSRPDAWERWFHAHDVDARQIHGMLCDQFATITQAARAGAGLALLPRFLIAEELSRGELVEVAPPAPHMAEEAYYLVWPVNRARYAPLVAFRDWLRGEAAAPRQVMVSRGP